MTETRYRCTACGNLTRFDVVTTSTTRSFHHYSVGGDLEIEEIEVIASAVDAVTCRWCGHGRGIDVVDGATVVESDDHPAEPTR